MSNIPIDKISDTKINLFTLEVLQIVKDAQQQHGLRHGDYQRYRQYCSRRIKRIRKTLHFPQGTKYKVQPKKLQPEMIKDIKFLYLPLVEAERCWAYAMQLKSEANTEPRKKFHYISRLIKAVKHSELLNSICHSELANCDARTKLEVNAYNDWMHGLLYFETKLWNQALEFLNKSKLICEKLAEAVSGDLKEVYLQKSQEIAPSIRYCEYNIGDATAVKDLLQMRKNVGSQDPLTSKLDELIEKTREGQANSFSEVTWAGRTLSVKNQQMRKLLVTLQQGDRSSEEEAASDQLITTHENLLKDIVEVQQSIRDDLKDDQSFKNYVKGSVPSNGTLLYSYVTYLKLMRMSIRNLLIIETMKSGGGSAKAGETTRKIKPQEFARLYDTLVQNFSEILNLPGIENDAILLNDINVQLLFVKSLRCFYICQTYTLAKKYKEAHALYGRTTDYADQALTGLSRRTIDPKKTAQMIEEIKQLLIDVETNKYQVLANSILDAGEAADDSPANVDTSKPLIENLENYIDDYPLKKPFNIVTLPPDFEPIPAKPILFDVAVNLIKVPNFESRLEPVKEGQAQAGVTGLFKKWFWGGEKK